MLEYLPGGVRRPRQCRRRWCVTSLCVRLWSLPPKLRGYHRVWWGVLSRRCASGCGTAASGCVSHAV